jgi:hypothetical protein
MSNRNNYTNWHKNGQFVTRMDYSTLQKRASAKGLKIGDYLTGLGYELLNKYNRVALIDEFKIEIKPLCGIDDKVNIKEGIGVQTEDGILIRQEKPYKVSDVKVTISIRTGKINYHYLIDHCWVSGDVLELVKKNDL